ncbi:MAG TPA: DnaD domain protein [Sumerlaeia bacterium]|nr:DnaD domain protein [Sumerlaeia bacterium]
MAGDWIKMTKGLEAAPEVIRMAAALSIPRDEVLGKLFRFWSWADTHLLNGDAVSVTEKFVDELASVAGFARAMADAGWLEPLSGDWTSGFHIPKFERHMGQSAKRRAVTATRNQKYRERVTKKRDADRDDASVTEASRESSLEKRREEKKKTPPPNPQDGEAVAAVAGLFEKASGRILSTLTLEKIADAIAEYGMDRIEKAISIADDAGATNWAYVEAVLRKGGDQKREKKAARDNGAPILPPGHPCHGRKKGEKWVADDGTQNTVGDDGWWWVQPPDSEPRRKEKIL